MTTRANNLPVCVAECKCGGDLLIYQARGKRAYLYSRCAVCGFNQQPHDRANQVKLWNLVPLQVRDTLPVPTILATPEATICPCCGRAAA